MFFVYYLIIINVTGLILCLFDKIMAIIHRYRIPEYILLLISFFGGCFGFAVGMNFFHHKTKKIKFKFVYLFCIMWFIIMKNFFK